MSLKDYKFPLRFHRGSLWINDDEGSQFCEMARQSDGEELCSLLNARFAENLGTSPQPIPTRQMSGVCNKCSTIHSTVCIGQKCKADSTCGGIIQDIDDQPKEDAEALAYCSLCREVRSTTEIGSKCGLSCGGTIVSVPIHKPNRKETLCIHGVRPDHFCAQCSAQAPPPIANRATTDEIASKYYASGRKLKIECWLKTLGDWFCPAMPEYDPGFTADLPWRIKIVKEHQVWHVFRDHTGGIEVAQVESEWHDILSKNPGWKLVGTLEGEVNA